MYLSICTSSRVHPRTSIASVPPAALLINMNTASSSPAAAAAVYTAVYTRRYLTLPRVIILFLVHYYADKKGKTSMRKFLFIVRTEVSRQPRPCVAGIIAEVDTARVPTPPAPIVSCHPPSIAHRGPPRLRCCCGGSALARRLARADHQWDLHSSPGNL